MVTYLEKDETGERLVRLLAVVRKRVRREVLKMAGVAFSAVAAVIVADVVIIAVVMR